MGCPNAKQQCISQGVDIFRYGNEVGVLLACADQ